MRFEFDDAPAAKGIRAQRNIAGVAAPGYMEGMDDAETPEHDSQTLR